MFFYYFKLIMTVATLLVTEVTMETSTRNQIQTLFTTVDTITLYSLTH